ncbi:chromosomal passenger protein, putative [Trypanosoma cruzi marinkellei]|uniref:Chromosomal passenger protein, putative n=1 Tax=Trypanosoma cruzi marinkellei TaxID=85056 RepID=K2NWG0_TRYCR|nr:chromosomal passenger protein, putative [Trypanosoma cruzi marinkellei]
MLVFVLFCFFYFERWDCWLVLFKSLPFHTHTTGNKSGKRRRRKTNKRGKFWWTNEKRSCESRGSMLSKNADYFEGLRTFPRDANALRHHGARLNYTLQKRYNIPSEVAELALQPQNAKDFDRYYRKQVMRIMTHFNAMTQRQIKVKVDPRLPRGMQIIRGSNATAPLKSGKTEKTTSDWRAAAASPSAKVNNAVSDHHKELDGMEANCMITHLQPEGQQTPQGVSPAFAAMMCGYTATDGKATVSSDDRSTIIQSSTKKSCREVLFGTPPEFKGFTALMEASPADSLMSKSPLLF